MKHFRWILPLIAIVGILIVLFWIIPEDDNRLDQVQQIEIEELKRENTVLLQMNDLLDRKIYLLQTITDSLQVLIAEEQQRIETLKTKKDEKIHRMDQFTDDELYQYFAGFNAQSN